MKHYLYEPAASAILGPDGAPVTSYETGLTSDKLFNGQPYSRLVIMATNTNGELATVTVPSTVDGLTTQRVQEAVRTLSFIKVKFIGLTLEGKGDSYNKLTWTGTAEKAEIVTATPTKS